MYVICRWNFKRAIRYFLWYELEKFWYIYVRRHWKTKWWYLSEIHLYKVFIFLICSFADDTTMTSPSFIFSIKLLHCTLSFLWSFFLSVIHFFFLSFPRWEERRTASGRVHYVNHITRTTQWEKPTRWQLLITPNSP